MDLNHGRLSPTDLQSVAIDHSAIPPHHELTGAGKGIRTSDLLITSQLLYRLSYTGFNNSGILQGFADSVKQYKYSHYDDAIDLRKCSLAFLNSWGISEIGRHFTVSSVPDSQALV